MCEGAALPALPYAAFSPWQPLHVPAMCEHRLPLLNEPYDAS